VTSATPVCYGRKLPLDVTTPIVMFAAENGCGGKRE
jgi:hypothetical protein